MIDVQLRNFLKPRVLVKVLEGNTGTLIFGDTRVPIQHSAE